METATLTKWPRGFDFSHSTVHQLISATPILKKEKEMHIFWASREGIMVQKSHFVRFKKQKIGEIEFLINTMNTTSLLKIS